MDVTIGIALVLLMATFIVIAIYYFRRQAVALEQVAEIEEERYMRQTRHWRKQDASNIQIDDPTKWFQKQAVLALGMDLQLLEAGRKYSNPSAIEFLANAGQRVIFSPLDSRAIKKSFAGNKSRGRGAAAKLQSMEGETPLLGRNPRNIDKGTVSLRDDEYFDLRAGNAGEKLGVQWGEPAKLWVYLVQA
jgi:hypothetical protein